MSVEVLSVTSVEEYERDAQEYLASLPLEHFMEGEVQAAQRKITLASMEWLEDAKGGFICLNEMLVQKTVCKEGKSEIVKLVPDNMLVLDGEAKERDCWMVEHEEGILFMALEYVSKTDPEKDYQKSFDLCEQVFEFPYYLLFDPRPRILWVYRHHKGKLVPIDADSNGRYPISDLDLSIGLQSGWVRFWFQGKLIPLTKEARQLMLRLQSQLDQLADSHRALQTAHSSLQTEKTALQSAHTALQTEKTGLQTEKTALQTKVTTLETEKTLLQQQIQKRDEDLQKAKEQADSMLALLRSLVETKAKVAPRQDILDRLASADLPQLQSWLAELS